MHRAVPCQGHGGGKQRPISHTVIVKIQHKVLKYFLEGFLFFYISRALYFIFRKIVTGIDMEKLKAEEHKFEQVMN